MLKNIGIPSSFNISSLSYWDNEYKDGESKMIDPDAYRVVFAVNPYIYFISSHLCKTDSRLQKYRKVQYR